MFGQIAGRDLIERGLSYMSRTRGDSTENVEKALTAYQAALSVFTPEAYPLDHIDTQDARIRCGRMARSSVAGSIYRRARASTPRARRLGFPARHETVEGIPPRPRARDALHRTRRGRRLALRAVTSGPRMARTRCSRRRPGIREMPAPKAPGARYTIPAQDDCRACHEGAPVPVLGFSALQLSPDRDPLAPHAESDRAERESALARRSRPAAQSAAGTAGESAAHHGGDARRARRARLPARQLRQLPQR